MSINVRSGSASRVIGSHVLPIKRPGESTGPNFYAQQKRRAYFCCSAGF